MWEPLLPPPSPVTPDTQEQGHPVEFPGRSHFVVSRLLCCCLFMGFSFPFLWFQMRVSLWLMWFPRV